MLTSFKVALGVSAAAMVGLTALQEARASDIDAQGVTTVVTQQDSRLDRKVSKSFTNATVSEVLNWLSSEGVSFVSRDEAVGGAKITLNLVNQPLRDAMRAIGAAMGGSWRKEGEVYVFTKGTFFGNAADVQVFAQGKPFFGEAGKFNAEEMKKLREKMLKESELSRGEAMKLRENALKDAQKYRTEALKAREKDAKNRTEFRFESKVMTPSEVRKLVPNVEVFAHPKPGAEVEVYRFGRDNAVRVEGNKVYQLTPQQRIEIEKRMKDSRGMSSDARRKLEETYSRARVAPLVQRQAPALRMGSGDIKALMRSLSPQQRQRHDRQGYLTAADLTQAQLKMLGTLPQSGSWTVSFTIDGDKLTIKNR